MISQPAPAMPLVPRKMTLPSFMLMCVNLGMEFDTITTLPLGGVTEAQLVPSRISSR
jgi:hypothetical protein